LINSYDDLHPCLEVAQARGKRYVVVGRASVKDKQRRKIVRVGQFACSVSFGRITQNDLGELWRELEGPGDLIGVWVRPPVSNPAAGNS
jgi:hypothetical protein